MHHSRPLIISDIAEIVFLVTLEAGAVTAFVAVAVLWCAWATGVL